MKSEPRAILKEAAEWRLIGLLFECPAGDWREQVAGLAAELGDVRIKAAVEAIGEDGTESLYHTTLGPGGPAAPREVSYHTTLLPGQLLGELTAFYKAFAYDPALPEAPDHVAVEVGFVAYLRLKQAYALEAGETGQADISAAACQRFLDDHLNALAEPLAKTLGASGIPYLAQTSAALLERVGLRRNTPPAVDPIAECDAEAALGCAPGEEG